MCNKIMTMAKERKGNDKNCPKERSTGEKKENQRNK